MNRLKQRGGFTLLEIIIVIIIIGVLASLALPRFFKTVEFSRATEALTHLSNIRQSMNRCYLPENSYTKCTDFPFIDVENPGTLPGSHFTYAIGGVDATHFTVTATRNATDNGDGLSTISINEAGVKSGTLVFGSIH